MIEYLSGDVIKHFLTAQDNADNPVYLAHATNCMGKWGAGIAKHLKRQFPQSYKDHKDFLHMNLRFGGQMCITSENIICLFTSIFYGYQKDSPEIILEHTREAVSRLLQQLPDNSTVYSNKFNSGLFNVPWKDTEKVLLEQLKKSKKTIKWIVCTL